MKTNLQTRQQVATAYRISYRTFNRWLKRAGIKLTSGLLTPKELKLIYEAFGPPPAMVTTPVHRHDESNH